MENKVRLINANAIPWCNYDLDNYHSFVGVEKEYVDDMPTIDPESLRPKGRWEECDWVEFDGHDECVHYPHEGRVCTNCRNAFKVDFVCDRRVEYCPHCGAKMED